VLSVFDHDRERQILNLVERVGRKDRSASDIGCGVGKFLPALAKAFGQVHAVDFSEALLDEARRRCDGLGNVCFRRADLCAGAVDLPVVDFTLCTNVILTPSLEGRIQLLENIVRQIAPGGTLALVVPSLESALYAKWRLVQWNIRDGVAPEGAIREGFETREPPKKKALREGVLDAGGIATKHFLKEELISWLGDHGIETGRVSKLEYDWDSEFEEPPGWMGEPYPWDWFLVAERV
jgi:SAM-dependent methyltransferase